MYFLLVLSGVVCTCSCARTHIGRHGFGCFESGETRIYATGDGDEVYYANFKKGQLVWDSRIPSVWPYGYAVYFRYHCKYRLEIWKRCNSGLTKVREAPDTVIYTKDEVTEEVENTLICFVNHFFPPSIKVKWTKNAEEIPADVSMIRYLGNSDGTFRHISTLRFTPQKGDTYACTVEHEALREPETRFWDPDVITESSSGPTIFCGVGLGLGLLGIAIGTFFFVKEKRPN